MFFRLLAAFVLLSTATIGNAAPTPSPVTYNFSFNNFTSFGYGYAPPVNLVTGSFTTTADGYSLLALNLQIAGHTYSTTNSVLYSFDSTEKTVGGGPNANQMTNGTDDFILPYSLYAANGAPNLSGWALYYTVDSAVSGVADVWSSRNVAVSVSAIPEPSIAIELFVGLCAVVGLKRSHRT